MPYKKNTRDYRDNHAITLFPEKNIMQKLKQTLTLKRVILGIVALFILMQLVPYGRSHSNPPVLQEPAWDNPQTAALVKTSCGDCHTNETVWPWYTNVAPSSWLVQRDVDEGRQHLNFSEWGVNGRRQAELKDMIKEVEGGGMPPLQYTIIHTDAKLTDAQRQQLIDGFNATFQ
jgi:mono/diheme cytochrome c family protein